MIKAFKIVTGFDASEYFEIDTEELARAYHCFLSDGKMITKNGIALRGKNILRIEPNWNALMGWNKGYKPTAYDMTFIPKTKKDNAFKIMLLSKKRAATALQENNTQLLTLKETDLLALKK